MRILVIGGCGYIGSILVPELIKQNHSVCVLDNLRYQQKPFLDICYCDNFKAVVGDCRDERMVSSLVSSYDAVICLSAIVRFNREFIQPEDRNFEKNYIKLFQLWFFSKYAKGFDNIYEFGCGTGFNIAVICQLFPETTCHGYDYVQPSVDLVNDLSHIYRCDASLFDMVCPDYSVKISNNGCVFTCGSIEQMGTNYQGCIRFILSKNPKLWCHQKPITDLLDKNNLVDYLAIEFQSKRRYAMGFLPHLQKLEKNGELEILKVKRTYFGSLYTEGYNYIIWRPKCEY